MSRQEVFDILFKHQKRIQKEGIVNSSLYLRREYPELIAEAIESGVDSQGFWQEDLDFIAEIVGMFEMEEF